MKPTLQDALDHGARLLQAGNAAEARRLADTLIRQFPASTPVRLFAADTAARMGDVTAAIACLDALPASINLWRCFLQWLGGMGILVLAVAVPLVSLLFKRLVAERWGVIILSAFIAHTAWHWMTERGSSLREYELTLPTFDLVLAASALRAAMVLTIAGAAAWAMLELHRRLSRPEPSPPEPQT